MATGHNATISDFDPRVDKIEFHVDAADLLPAFIRDAQGGARLSFDGNTITLTGVGANQMTRGDPIFLNANSETTQHNLRFV